MFSPQARYLHEMRTCSKRTAYNPAKHDHSQAILSLVSAGIGLAIVPAGTQNARSSDVIFMPLDLCDDYLAELHMIWSPDNRSPLLRDVRDIIIAAHAGTKTR